MHITKIYTLKYIIKKFRNKITIHFIIIYHYKKSTQKMNIEFTVWVCAYLYYWKHESKLQCNPMFCWKKIPKQHLKFMLYQNKVYDFLPQVPLALPTFSPNSNFLSHLLFLSFSRTPPFKTILSHIIMIQNNKNSKFKLTKFLD